MALFFMCTKLFAEKITATKGVNMSNKQWIGFDLDGTLAFYDGWHGLQHIGEPIPRIINLCKKYINDGVEVRIVTARVCSQLSAEEIELARKAIEEWCIKHIGKKLPVTAEKDFNMMALYDDRAHNVTFNDGI